MAHSLQTPLTLSRSDASEWTDLRVTSKQAETPNIFVFELAQPDGEALLPFRAGAHLEVQIGAVTRHYSLCSSPEERHCYRVAVQREAKGRGGSVQLCDEVAEGDVITVRGPFNHFALVPSTGQPPLLLAGGIGVTPVLCMAMELAAAGQDFELHFSGRSLEHMAFLSQLRSGALARHARIYADDGKGAPPLDLATVIGEGRPGRHLYVCGPGGMIDATADTARLLGWASDHIHFERFGAPAQAAPAGAAACEVFEVEIASTGQRIPVPADQSVAQALALHGVHISVSCESGVCGSCRTGVLAGVPDHRDYLLSPEEQAEGKSFTPCCSRSCTPLLVLDL